MTTCAPHLLPMFGKGWTRKAFGQRIGHILRTCAFRQLDVAIAYELPQILHSSVNMPRALPICGIFAHHEKFMIQEALSSHISVAPTCRKLKPRSSARK